MEVVVTAVVTAAGGWVVGGLADSDHKGTPATEGHTTVATAAVELTFDRKFRFLMGAAALPVADDALGSTASVARGACGVAVVKSSRLPR